MAVAVTGGIGAGKSETLRAFARHGAAVISSDDIVHELLREDPEVREAVVGRLGEGVLGADGQIDRGKVGRLVFSDPEALRWLEGLLHPRVVASYLRWRDELAEQLEPPAVCVTEVPLLYEVGGESRFDKVVVVTASPQVRIARRLGP
ncbi:MAG: dephospho-CoA kinase, partial [Gaiellaceae bacterium]